MRSLPPRPAKLARPLGAKRATAPRTVPQRIPASLPSPGKRDISLHHPLPVAALANLGMVEAPRAAAAGATTVAARGRREVRPGRVGPAAAPARVMRTLMRRPRTMTAWRFAAVAVAWLLAAATGTPGTAAANPEVSVPAPNLTLPHKY